MEGTATGDAGSLHEAKSGCGSSRPSSSCAPLLGNRSVRLREPAGVEVQERQQRDGMDLDLDLDLDLELLF